MSEHADDDERVVFLRGVLVAFASNRQILPYDQARRFLGTSKQEIGSLLRSAAEPFIAAGQPDISAIVVNAAGTRTADSTGPVSAEAAAEQVRRVHDYWEARRHLDNDDFKDGLGKGEVPAFPARARSAAAAGPNAAACPHHRTAPRDVISALPHSQAGEGRHRCAVCAYHAGVEAGLSKS